MLLVPEANGSTRREKAGSIADPGGFHPRLHGSTPAHTVEFLSQLRERLADPPDVVSPACTASVTCKDGGHQFIYDPAANANRRPFYASKVNKWSVVIRRTFGGRIQ
jgi:hypothetical protein